MTWVQDDDMYKNVAIVALEGYGDITSVTADKTEVYPGDTITITGELTATVAADNYIMYLRISDDYGAIDGAWSSSHYLIVGASFISSHTFTIPTDIVVDGDNKLYIGAIGHHEE